MWLASYETQNRTDIRVTQPCSSASQVISEGSDLYRPNLSREGQNFTIVLPTVNANTKSVFSNPSPFAVISQLSVSNPICFSIFHFGVRFVTLDNNAGRSESLSIIEFSQ